MPVQKIGKRYENFLVTQTKEKQKAAENERDRHRARIENDANRNILNRTAAGSYDDDESLPHARLKDRRASNRVAELDTSVLPSDRTTQAEPPTPPASTVGYEDGSRTEDVAGLQAKVRRQQEQITNLEGELDTERQKTRRLQDEKRATTMAVAQAYVDGSSENTRKLKDRIQALGDLVSESKSNEEKLERQIVESTAREDDLRRQLREAKYAEEELSFAAAHAKSHEQDVLSSSVASNPRKAAKASQRSQQAFISVPKGQRESVFPLVLRSLSAKQQRG